MLVKFLSFTASVIGTARYKAVLLSCLVLAFSTAGVAGMALLHGSGSRSAASTLEKTDTQDNTQQGSPQLGNSRKQTIQNEGSVAPQTNQEPSSSAQPTPTPKPATGSVTTTKPVEITLGVTELPLAPGETSDWLDAKVPEGNSVEWTVTLGDAPGLSIINKEQSATGLRLQVRADQNTTQTGAYQVILHAKDSKNSAIQPKTITINVL